MIDRYVDHLKRLQWIHLQCGLEDEYGAQFGHRQDQKLSSYAISHLLEQILASTRGIHIGI